MTVTEDGSATTDEVVYGPGIDPERLAVCLSVLEELDKLEVDHPDAIVVRRATAGIYRTVKQRRRQERRAAKTAHDKTVTEATATGSEAPLYRLRLDSILHPVAGEIVKNALAEADEAGAAALVVELSTPGGLLTTTREISTAIQAARTPVVVWVAPAGSQAASAGFFLPKVLM